MKFSRERVRFFVEIGAVCAAIACLGAALAGDEWFDVVGADLSDSGFGTNLSLHGGVFQSCGPPIDPNSTEEKECFKFEEILGPYTPLQLLQIRGFLAFTLLMLVMGLFCGSKYAVEFYFLAFAGDRSCIFDRDGDDNNDWNSRLQLPGRAWNSRLARDSSTAFYHHRAVRSTDQKAV